MAFTSVPWNNLTYTVPGFGDTGWSGSLGVDGLLISLGTNALSLAGVQTPTNKTFTRKNNTASTGVRYSVKDYGAVGNGTTDDTTAINLALAAMTTGGVLLFPQGTYKVTGNLTVSAGSNITLVGEGVAASVISFSDTFGINVSVTGATLMDLGVTGPGSTTNTNSVGINVYGTAATYLSDIRIVRCKVTNFNGYGIALQYVKKFEIIDCTVTDVSYTGIAVTCSSFGFISRNLIQNINVNYNFANAYGIVCSYNNSSFTANGILIAGSATLFSDHIMVSANVVDTVTNWEALDTHNGQYISFVDNVCSNVACGISIGQTALTIGPIKSCVAIGNTIDTGTSKNNNAIKMNGDPVGGIATDCIISNNVIKGGGDDVANTSAAIVIRDTQNLIVSANVIDSPWVNAILMSTNCLGFSLTGNIVIDCKSASWGNCCFVRLQADTYTGIISGNTMVRTAAASPGNVNNYFIFNDTAAPATTTVTVGTNCSVATTYFRNTNTSFTTPLGVPLTASRAVSSDSSGNLTSSATTSTELGFVNGVTSAIQTQINTKAPTASPTFTGTVTTATVSFSLLRSLSSNPAATGVIALANTDLITWRNAANSADCNLSVNASNFFAFGGATSGLDLLGGNMQGVVSIKGSGTGPLQFYTNGTIAFSIDGSQILNSLVSANESTGAGSAALGANSPAVTLTAPFKWLKVKTSDGSTGYIPIWK